MKRRASDSDIRHACHRHARSSAAALSVCIPTWKPPSPSTSSKQALCIVGQQHLQHTLRYSSEYTSGYIRRWLDNIELNYENHTMPPTPPSTFARIPRGASARERRGSRQSTLTSDTQTPKATKTLTPETYRQINLRASCIFIDNKVIIPPAIDEYIRQILSISSWEDQVPAPNGIGMQPLFDEVADKYHRESERLASTCSLEGDWRHCLCSVMCQMNNRLGQALEINACEKGKLTA